MEDIVGEILKNVIIVNRPFIGISDGELAAMIITSEATIKSPLFPPELKPKTHELLVDLVHENISRS